MSMRISSYPLGKVMLVGLVSGLFGGLFGVGGGFIIVPGLVYLLGFDQRLAHGTSLTAVLPIAVASLATYSAAGDVDWAYSAWIAVGAVAGAVVGTSLLQIIPKRPLIIIFCIVLGISAIRLLIPNGADTAAPTIDLAIAIGLIVVGLVAGIMAGLLGVGGGIIIVPSLVVLYSIAPVLAKGISVAVIIPTAIIGTWRNRVKSNTQIPVAVVVGISGIITAVIGGIISARLSSTLSNVLFAALLIAIIARQLTSFRELSETR